MARFEVQKACILDADGAEREYEVIADRSTFTVDDTPFGRIRSGRGFLRCRGQRYVGTFGHETPVYVGSEADVYYAPMFFFDGAWSHAVASERGVHSHVTAESGTGKLFAALEAFCQGTQVATY